MMKSTDLGHCHDPTHVRGLNSSSFRRILPKRKMTARAVIIVEVASHMRPERGFIYDDYVIQASATNRANQSFDVRGLPGRPGSRENCQPVPESQNLNLQRGSCPKGRGQTGEQGYQRVTHGSGRYQDEVPRATISVATEFLIGTGIQSPSRLRGMPVSCQLACISRPQ
jgi:hypothetical protein